MTMYGGITFRQVINNNKLKIVEYLTSKGEDYTSEICANYGGEQEMPAVRKALNELRKDGVVTTDDEVSMWRGKLWKLNKL